MTEISDRHTWALDSRLQPFLPGRTGCLISNTNSKNGNQCESVRNAPVTSGHSVELVTFCFALRLPKVFIMQNPSPGPYATQ